MLFTSGILSLKLCCELFLAAVALMGVSCAVNNRAILVWLLPLGLSNICFPYHAEPVEKLATSTLSTLHLRVV